MMTMLLLHRYASGIYSSRWIVKAIVERLDFMMVMAGIRRTSDHLGVPQTPSESAGGAARAGVTATPAHPEVQARWHLPESRRTA
jgi:hypothetical protein